jgi:hypothetical protein
MDGQIERIRDNAVSGRLGSRNCGLNHTFANTVLPCQVRHRAVALSDLGLDILGMPRARLWIPAVQQSPHSRSFDASRLDRDAASGS